MEFLLLFLPLTLVVAWRLRGQPLLRWIAFTSVIFYAFAGHWWFIVPMLIATTSSASPASSAFSPTWCRSSHAASSAHSPARAHRADRNQPALVGGDILELPLHRRVPAGSGAADPSRAPVAGLRAAGWSWSSTPYHPAASGTLIRADRRSTSVLAESAAAAAGAALAAPVGARSLDASDPESIPCGAPSSSTAATTSGWSACAR
jgi:hypothetical protein